MDLQTHGIEVTMPLEVEGKKILKEPAYDMLRDIIIEDIVQTIDREGKYGQELRPVIENTLRNTRFKSLVAKLFENILKQTDIKPEECERALSMLMEEDIAEDIKRNLQDQVEEHPEDRRGDERGELYGQGESGLLWRDVPKRYLGSRISVFRDVVSLVARNITVQVTFLGGVALLIISAILFGSIYHAVIAGLTLTALPAETVSTRLANVLGAMGGILIFFVSLSLVFQYLFLARSRDERIRDIAARYLQQKREQR